MLVYRVANNIIAHLHCCNHTHYRKRFGYDLPHRLEDPFAWLPKAALPLLHLVRDVVEGKAAQAAGTGNLWNCLSVADLVHFNMHIYINEGSLSLCGVGAILIFGMEERRVNCLLCHFRSLRCALGV